MNYVQCSNKTEIGGWPGVLQHYVRHSTMLPVAVVAGHDTYFPGTKLVEAAAEASMRIWDAEIIVIRGFIERRVATAGACRASIFSTPVVDP